MILGDGRVSFRVYSRKSLGAFCERLPIGNRNGTDEDAGGVSGEVSHRESKSFSQRTEAEVKKEV